MHKLKELFQASDEAVDYITHATSLMVDRLRAIQAEQVARVIDVIEEAREADRTIFVIGNGGSAAVASHFVNDLGVNSLVPGVQPFRIHCLVDNVASLTAVANDVEYDDVFRRQVECVMRPGDVVIGLSVSGNSENVVRAVEYAKAHGGRTVGLCGFDGGRLARAADTIVLVGSSRDEYGPVEDAFSVVFHVVSSYLSMRGGRFLHH